MVQTERDTALLIDWRLARIQELKKKIRYNESLLSRNDYFSGDQVCQAKTKERFYQGTIVPYKKRLAEMHKEIDQMDPSATIRVMMVDVYLDALEKTKDAAYICKIKNMNLTPTTLLRILSKRLTGQYANSSLCAIYTSSLMKKEVTNAQKKIQKERS